MIAARIMSARKSEIIETPEPTIQANEVLIEIKRAGVCGTDLHIWHGSYGLAAYPIIPGHEFSGVIAEIGSEVEGLKLGDPVTADPNLPCYYCEFCQRKQFNQCSNLQVIGVTKAGAFSDYVAVPASAVYSIGELSFAEAALIEPLACVVWGLQQVNLQAGDRVLIFGAGPMGILMMQAVKRAGASFVAMVDKEQGRLELAKQLGASTTEQADFLKHTSFKDIAPQGFDIVADATGNPKVIENSFNFVRPGGKVWIFGVTGPKAHVKLFPYDVFRNDLKVIGSFALNKTFHEALALIESRAVNVTPLVSHTLSLKEFEQGLDIAESDEKRMKIQFAPST